MRRPEGLTLEQAAAVPEAFVTAHDALVTIGAVAERATVLVHAVGSGVGVAAAQIAAACGARVFGTARSSEKRARAMEFGLEAAFDGESWEGSLRDTLGERGVDVIVDFVGANYLRANVALLAPRGRLVVVGLLGGARAELDLSQLLRKRARIEGTVLRSRSDVEKAAASAAFEAWSAPRWATGAVRPVIDRVFSLDQAAEAQAVMAANDNFGKIVLRVQ